MIAFLVTKHPSTKLSLTNLFLGLGFEVWVLSFSSYISKLAPNVINTPVSKKNRNIVEAIAMADFIHASSLNPLFNSFQQEVVVSVNIGQLFDQPAEALPKSLWILVAYDFLYKNSSKHLHLGSDWEAFWRSPDKCVSFIYFFYEYCFTNVFSKVAILSNFLNFVNESNGMYNIELWNPFVTSLVLLAWVVRIKYRTRTGGQTPRLGIFPWRRCSASFFTSIVVWFVLTSGFRSVLVNSTDKPLRIRI